MEILSVIAALILTYAIIQTTLAVFGFGKPDNLPPGPTRLPIIGNLHLLGDQPHQSLAKLAKIHGPIMSIKLGQITTLVISSATSAKQVLQTHDTDFCNRHVPDCLHAQQYFKYSMGFMPISNQWRTLRKIINSNVSSAKSLDASHNLRAEKVKELVEYCRKASLSNDSVNIGRAAFRTLLNLISNIIFSKDLTDPYDGDSAKEFKELVAEIMVEAAKPNLVDFFPMLRKIDPQGNRRRMDRHFGKILDVFEELIQERLNRKPNSHDDLLALCLKFSRENPNELSRLQIKMLFLDLFTAGTDTAAGTIEWAMTELLRNPHVMAKAKEELEKAITTGKIINDDDILKLPYLSCIVKETLRLHSPSPLLLPRKTLIEVQLDEYTIPAGTQVLVNAWAIGRDPCIWKDPEEFKPERFLASPVDVQGQDFELIPFGGGRRICPGMPLALRMIPMVLGSLLNNFNWNLDTRIKHNDLDVTERFGITIQKANPLLVVPVSLS